MLAGRRKLPFAGATLGCVAVVAAGVVGAAFGLIGEGCVGGGHGSLLPGAVLIGAGIFATQWLPPQFVGFGVYTAYGLVAALLANRRGLARGAGTVLTIHTINTVAAFLVLQCLDRKSVV